MTLSKKPIEKPGGEIAADQKSDRVLFRASVTPLLEIYSDERLAEFDRNNERALVGFQVSKELKNRKAPRRKGSVVPIRRGQ